MKRHSIGIILFFIFLGAALFAVNFDLLSITGPNDKQVSSIGQEWTLTAPWGGSGYFCGVGGNVVTTDGTTKDSISVSATLPNTGSRQCGSYTASLRVSLDSLDLSSVQKVVIRRSVRLSAAGKGGASYGIDTMGIPDGKTVFDNTINYGSVSVSVGDVYVNNDGTVITVKTDYGSKIFDATKPLYFTDAVLVSAKDNTYGGNLAYTITSIEITPFPATSVTTPVANNPPEEATQSPLLEEIGDSLVVIVDEPRSWWDRFLAWFRSLFN